MAERHEGVGCAIEYENYQHAVKVRTLRLMMQLMKYKQEYIMHMRGNGDTSRR